MAIAFRYSGEKVAWKCYKVTANSTYLELAGSTRGVGPGDVVCSAIPGDQGDVDHHLQDGVA
jgi:hypothetical protein